MNQLHPMVIAIVAGVIVTVIAVLAVAVILEFDNGSFNRALRILHGDYGTVE